MGYNPENSVSSTLRAPVRINVNHIANLAARTALKRKKAHEQTLEQTSQQITMLENQIYSIEAANINQETLNAMKNAGKAMKDIHGNLNIDKVDQIMYVLLSIFTGETKNRLTAYFPGKNLPSKKSLPTRSATPSPMVHKQANPSTKPS